LKHLPLERPAPVLDVSPPDVNGSVLCAPQWLRSPQGGGLVYLGLLNPFAQDTFGQIEFFGYLTHGLPGFSG
jgi:hypothetical protein